MVHSDSIGCVGVSMTRTFDDSISSFSEQREEAANRRKFYGCRLADPLNDTISITLLVALSPLFLAYAWYAYLKCLHSKHQETKKEAAIWARVDK